MIEVSRPARRDVVDTATSSVPGRSVAAEFLRFVVVGGLSSALYAALFLLLGGVSAQTANLIATFASTVLANELHRRLTFRAGGRVTWLAAQLQGGGLSVIALLGTSLSLGVFDQLVRDTTALQQLLLVGAVSGAFGLVRFATLRAWVFSPPTPHAEQDGLASAPSLPAAAIGPKRAAPLVTSLRGSFATIAA